jgi:hypothetical protein
MSRFTPPAIIKNATMPNEIKQDFDSCPSRSGKALIVAIKQPDKYHMVDGAGKVTCTYWTVEAWISIDPSVPPICLQSLCMGAHGDTDRKIAREFADDITEVIGSAMASSGAVLELLKREDEDEFSR